MDVYQIVTAGVIGMGGLIAGAVIRKMERLILSIESLNVKVAVVISKLESHEKRIAYLELKRGE